MYKVFSSFFIGPPVQEVVELLINPGMLEELGDILGKDSIALLKKHRENFRENYNELKKEYNALFVVPLEKYVTPYESVYRCSKHADGTNVQDQQLMGPCTIAVKEFYDSVGADIEGVKELPDHLGVELEFMHFLCKREEEAREKEDEEEVAQMLSLQKEFLHEHLYQWIGAICDNISKKSSNDFYQAIAGITHEFVKLDYNMLSTDIM